MAVPAPFTILTVCRGVRRPARASLAGFGTMLPDLRILIPATIATFVLSAAAGLYASIRITQEPLNALAEGRSTDEQTPSMRISASWPTRELPRGASLHELALLQDNARDAGEALSSASFAIQHDAHAAQSPAIDWPDRQLALVNVPRPENASLQPGPEFETSAKDSDRVPVTQDSAGTADERQRAPAAGEARSESAQTSVVPKSAPAEGTPELATQTAAPDTHGAATPEPVLPRMAVDRAANDLPETTGSIGRADATTEAKPAPARPVRRSVRRPAAEPGPVIDNTVTQFPPIPIAN